MGVGVGWRISGDSERTGISRNPGCLGFRVSQVTGASNVVKKRELSLHPQSTLGGRRALLFRIVRKLDSGCPSGAGVLKEGLRAGCGGRTIPSLSRVSGCETCLLPFVFVGTKQPQPHPR